VKSIGLVVKSGNPTLIAYRDLSPGRTGTPSLRHEVQMDLAELNNRNMCIKKSLLAVCAHVIDAGSWKQVFREAKSRS